MYYELLNPKETVTAVTDTIIQIEVDKKRFLIVSKWRKVILLHNSQLHVALSVKQTLLELEWEILQYPAYSPDIAPADFHLHRPM